MTCASHFFAPLSAHGLLVVMPFFQSDPPTSWPFHSLSCPQGDLCLWEVLDLHMRIPDFKAKIEQQVREGTGDRMRDRQQQVCKA